jgi:hypothetical protein
LSENPNAIKILEQNLDKVKWDSLSRNPNAMHILKRNLNKIDWYYISANPSIFEIDNAPTKTVINQFVVSLKN